MIGKSARSRKKRLKQIPLYIVFIGVVLLSFVGSIGILREWRHHFAHQSTTQQVPAGKTIPYSQGHLYTPPANPGSPSPYLFGTNLRLLDANDQVLTSKTTQNEMQLLHVRIVRLTLRPTLTEGALTEAAQAIKNMGALPLVALEGMQEPDTAQADDLQAVKIMNQVFGKSLVYYEYGNEDDNNGISIEQYTSGWNSVIPQIKKVALQGSFIGPVSYQYNHNTLTSFLQNARPQPNEISWHEYACTATAAKDTCLTNVGDWSTHIADARASMQLQLNTLLPIMITAWNYTAPQASPDKKYQDGTFINTWTSKALHTLATNQVFASMQYTVTGTTLPLIAKDATLTPMGTTFQSLYLQMISKEDFGG